MRENRAEVATKQSTKPANPSCWKKSNHSRAALMGMMLTASTVVMMTSRIVRFLEGKGSEGSILVCCCVTMHWAHLSMNSSKSFLLKLTSMAVCRTLGIKKYLDLTGVLGGMSFSGSHS